MLSSRVLALSLFASEFTYYIGIVCVVHWLIMFIWIVNMKTTFCDNRIEELFYNAILALIFIFCYFNPVEGPSRKRYLFYYTVMFIENLIILLLWYNVCDIFKWYRLPAFILFFTSFFIGLIFMVIIIDFTPISRRLIYYFVIFFITVDVLSNITSIAKYSKISPFR